MSTEANQFVKWMEGTPATIDAPVDASIPDESVGATAPLGNISQDATGYSGPDFRPNIVSTHRPEKVIPKYNGVILDPGEEDYVDGVQSAKRQSFRDRLVQRYTEQILEEHKDIMARYDRAMMFLDKFATAEDLTKDQQEKLIRAQQLVEKGPPMTQAIAREMAIKRASEQVITTVD